VTDFTVVRRRKGSLLFCGAKCRTWAHGPSVWTGRALQAESDDLESWSCASVSGLL